MTFQEHYFDEVGKVASLLKTNQVIDTIIEKLIEARASGKRIFFIGSGGGAGHASHATCDFRKLAGFEAYCPTDNVSELTARINDEGWDSSIAECLKAMRLSAGEIIFVFSVGGGDAEKNISANLVQAIKYGKSIGAEVVGVVGRDGGFAGRNGNCVVINVEDKDLITPIVEAYQAVVWHLIVSDPRIQVQKAKWESTEQIITK